MCLVTQLIRIKRIFALALCQCLLSGVCGALSESFFARQIDWCETYVNLLECPDSKSRSLCKVYIGEVVMASRYKSAFSYCCYNGQYGFVLWDYLAAEWHEGGQ